MGKRAKVVTAVYERDPRGIAWAVHVAEEPRCHSWGRTLAGAAIIEATELWLDELGVSDPEGLLICDDVRVPHAAEAHELAAARSD